MILQNTPYPTDRTRQLQDRLAVEFPGRHFPVMMYGPSLATMIGPDGMGVVVHEGPEEEDDLVMPRILVMTDSTCDLPPEWVRRFDMRVVPTYVHFGQESLADDGVQLTRT